MKIATLSLFLLKPAAADLLGPEEPANLTCPVIVGCCEEDCCGPGTSYIATGFCQPDPLSSGWDGTYSDRYQLGCLPRACCEDECCAEGTIYDSQIECCVLDPSFPQGSSTTTPPPPVTNGTVDVCFVEITGRPCICNEDGFREHDFVALGAPRFDSNGDEGEYEWESSDESKVEIINANDRVTAVRAIGTSEEADDVTLTVTYIVDGVECFNRFDLTVIRAELEFKMEGMWDPANDATKVPKYGDPVLGPVTPGAPPACTGFHKNIEITATITPCDDLPKCRFDFKREKQGYGGFIDAAGGKSFAQKVSEPFNPAGTWDDDDGGANPNFDEDLVLEKEEGCKLFVLDVPGIRNVGSTCTAAEVGDQWYNFKNFREWLNVNGEQCTDYLLWRASTYIECVNAVPSPLWQEADMDGFNANDVGESDETQYEPPPGSAPIPTRRLDARKDSPESIGLVS